MEKLKEIPDNSIDTIITDPPYGLSFMGKKWDYDVPSIEIWKECLRVLKPGGTALIFAGSRTQHRMAVNIEDAGFILKDTVMWLYGSGFPKATDISKQIDKMKGVEREVIGYKENEKNFRDLGKKTKEQYGLDKLGIGVSCERQDIPITESATPEAKLWDGWKSHGLKPAYEPILVAVKPNDGTYANNALKWGVSGLWIDGGRIDTQGEKVVRNFNDFSNIHSNKYGSGAKIKTQKSEKTILGRFPANVILDEESAKMLDEQSGISKSQGGRIGKKSKSTIDFGLSGKYKKGNPGFGDVGGASRFFYCAKASKSERNFGLDNFKEKPRAEINKMMGNPEGFLTGSGNERTKVWKNNHPTVKPIKLMEYLCKLTKTPTGGIVLDPFIGSGTTAIACLKTGRQFIGIEKEPEYVEIAKARIKPFLEQLKLK